MAYGVAQLEQCCKGDQAGSLTKVLHLSRDISPTDDPGHER